MKKTIFTIFLISAVFFVASPLSNAQNVSLTFNLWEDISYNFVVPQIVRIQTKLIKDGFLSASPTGYYGPKTKKAIIEFQKTHELEPTGIVGSLTRRIIIKEIANGKTAKQDPIFKKLGNFDFSKDTDKTVTTKELSVPLIEQQYPLSCESASLQMALAFKGVIKTQDELISKIGVSEPVEKYKDKLGATIWGDPNIGFVGDIKGWMYTNTKGMVAATGWGVNKDPIALAAKVFRPKSEGISNATIENVISEISNGNPVIVWRYSKLPESLLTLKTYKTSQGKTIEFKPTHVNVVVGFRKDLIGNYTFLINDPEYGRIEQDQKLFEEIWSKYHNDMVVVR